MHSLYKSALDEVPFKSLTDKCIILDLDETLVHSSENLDDLWTLNLMRDPNLIDLRRRTYRITMDDVVSKRGTGVKTVMWGIVRPHAREFLISCFAYFKVVIVWSAGKRKYVDAIVDYLFKDMRRPIVVYSRDECVKTTNGLLVKPLRNMITDEPGLNRYMGLHNSFMIDDRTTVYEGYKGDNPYNGVQIPAYRPAFTIESLRSDDIALKQLMTWFMRPEVMKSKDVRELDKSGIFTTSVTSFPSYKNIKPFQSSDEDEIGISNRVSKLVPLRVR